jgi:peptidoglycan biosynthesis protein MviN/MurJ (putative lipid II flippase)
MHPLCLEKVCERLTYSPVILDEFNFFENFLLHTTEKKVFHFNFRCSKKKEYLAEFLSRTFFPIFCLISLHAIDFNKIQEENSFGNHSLKSHLFPLLSIPPKKTMLQNLAFSLTSSKTFFVRLHTVL